MYDGMKDKYSLEQYQAEIGKNDEHNFEVMARFCYGNVLDIGCGNGKYAGSTYEAVGHEYLSNENTIIGLDPLKSVEDRFPVVEAYGEEIPFQDNVFDAVVICSVLDHLKDPMVVLREAKRVLKDGGKAFVWNSVQEGEDNPFHMHTWNKQELVAMISEVFKIRTTREVGVEPRYVVLFVEGEKQ